MGNERCSMSEQDHWVYVVELEPEAWESAYVGVVYVGETALSPEERFAKHVSGARTAARIGAREAPFDQVRCACRADAEASHLWPGRSGGDRGLLQ